MAEPMIHLQIMSIAVSLLPPDHIDHQSFAVSVQWRGNDRWSVMHHGHALGADGLAAHRFDYDTAMRLAVEHAPRVVVNGRTAADVAARIRVLATGEDSTVG